MASSAASGSRAAIASTISVCSAYERSGRPGKSTVRYWKRTSCELSVLTAAWPSRGPRSRGSGRAAGRSRSRPPAGLRARAGSRISATMLAQLGDRGVVGVQRRVTRRESLERGAGLEDLDRLDLGHASHPGAAVALALHEPVMLEPDERHPHGRASEPEPLAQVLFEQSLARQQLSAHNRLAQILVTVGPDRQQHLSVRCMGLAPGRRCTSADNS